MAAWLLREGDDGRCCFRQSTVIGNTVNAAPAPSHACARASAGVRAPAFHSLLSRLASTPGARERVA